jgi:hypothetical protein
MMTTGKWTENTVHLPELSGCKKNRRQRRATGRRMDSMAKHECKRFKKVMKRGGVLYVVACRECGKKRKVADMHAIKGPDGKLP